MLFGQCFDKLGRAFFFKKIKVGNYVSLSLSKVATNRFYRGSGTGLGFDKLSLTLRIVFKKKSLFLQKYAIKPTHPFKNRTSRISINKNAKAA
jgi:hypothetical protein